MPSHIDQLPSDSVKTTTTTAAMDEDTTTLSSSPGVPTPTSSTPAPKTEILVHAPECEMAIESKEKCPDGGNCADCQLNQLHSHADYWSLRADCTCDANDDDDSTTSAVDAPAGQQTRLSLVDELILGSLMEPGTLEAARQHIDWLAGQINEAIVRATQNLAAGVRPRPDDTWIINEAGTLLSRLVPRMGGHNGGFSLDHGQLYAIPDAVWPPPAPPIPAGEMDHSAMARRKMEVFTSRVGSQLAARKEEQQRSARPLVGDWLKPHPTTTTTVNAAPALAPTSAQDQPKALSDQSSTDDIATRPPSLLDLKEQKSLQSTGPLVVNGSTPYPKTTTTTTTEAATPAPSATPSPEQQPSPEPPSTQTPAEDFSSYIEKQIEQRRTRTPLDDVTLPPLHVRAPVTRVASQPRDTPGHQHPPQQQQQQQQHEQPLNFNLGFHPTPDASRPIFRFPPLAIPHPGPHHFVQGDYAFEPNPPITGPQQNLGAPVHQAPENTGPSEQAESLPAPTPRPFLSPRGQVLRFPPAALPHPGPHHFVQGDYTFEPNPPITGPQQILDAPVHQSPENAAPREPPESPAAPTRPHHPFVGGIGLPPPLTPPPPPHHTHHDSLQAAPSQALPTTTMRIPAEQRHPNTVLPGIVPPFSPQPLNHQHLQDDLQAQRLHKWAFARENQFWTPPGQNVRAYAHVCADFLGLPPPSDHDIFGHEHGHP